MAVQTPPTKKSSSALPWPALVPLGHHTGKPPISLQKMVMLVGSRHNAHLHLMSRHVSKAHALILSHGGSVYIRDLASREHVYVNGVKQREAWLRNGDLLKIGSFTFKFKAGPPKVQPGADAPEEGADLEVEGAEAPLSIAEKVMLIGRRPTCDVSLTEPSVSTAHAVIFHVAGKRYVRDLGSRTGTFVNGQKIHQAELNPGDAIRIGETDMRFTLAGAHEHHIEPVGADNALDELEHLVGTAPLDVAGEITPEEVAGAGGAGGVTGGVTAVDVPPVTDDELRPDDLIEIDLSPEPVEPVEAEHGAGALGFTADAGAVAGGAAPGAVSGTTPADEEEPLVEIDLSADPDVSGVPATSSDTRALGTAFDAVPPKPTISERVVDDLGDGGARSAAADSLEVSKEEWDAAAAADDEGLGTLGFASAPVEELEISPRGGWQGMSRVEDDTLAGELDSPLTRVDEVTIAPVEEAAEAPEIVAPPVDELPIAPVEETPPAPEIAVAPEEPVRQTETAPAQDEFTLPLSGEGETSPFTQEPIEETSGDEALPLVDWAPAEEPAGGAAGVEEMAVEDVALERVVEETPVEVEAAAVEPLAIEEPPAPPAVEPVEDVAEVTFDADVVAPTPEEAAEAQSVTEEAPPAAELPLVAEPPVTEEGPGADEETSATTAADVLAGAVEPEAEPEPDEDQFAKKARSRKGKGRKPAPTSARPGKHTRGKAATGTTTTSKSRSKKGKAAEVADETLTSATAPDVTPSDVTSPVAPIAGAVAAAGVVGAALVAEKVIGEETNVVAAEAGAAADIEGIAGGAAEMRPAAAADAFVTEPTVGGDVEGIIAPPETLSVEESVVPAGGVGDVEIVTEAAGEVAEVAPAPLSATDTAAFEAEVTAEAGMLESALEETPIEGADVADVVTGGAELVVAPPETPREEDVPLVLETGGTEEVVGSAPELNLGAEEPAGESLTDSAFGRQMAAFTETSSGEIVEDFAGLAPEEPTDADEALAIALDSANAGESEQHPEHEQQGGEPELVSWAQEEQPGETAAAMPTDAEAGVVEWADEGVTPAAEPGGMPPAGVEYEEEEPATLDLTATAADDVLPVLDEEAAAESIDVTAGGVEPEALGVVTDEHLSAQQFEASGESVELDTPGLAEADAVLGGQEFSAEGEADAVHDARESVTEELDGQAFVAEPAAPEDVKEVPAPPEPVPAAPSPQQAPRGPVPGAMGGGFTIGTDLSSFIGGMPLVLPDLPPQPSGFGKVEVSFAGAKTPWQQAQRPSFPMGQGLAQEVMDAAKGLRDVEDMDAAEAAEAAAAAMEHEGEAPAEEIGEESVTDDGAPGDEWNVAAVLEDEDEPVSMGWAPAEHTGEASMTAALPPAEPEEEPPVEVSELSHTVDEELTEEQLLEITGELDVADPFAGEPTATAEEQASGFEVEDAAAGEVAPPATIDELSFDEPTAEPGGGHGAVDEEIGELEFDEEPATESVIDRSPPPPVTPPPPPVAPTKAKGAGAKMPPPPPPAKSHRPRPAGAPRSLSGAPPEDDASAREPAGGPFGGAGVAEVDVFATPSVSYDDASASFGGGGSSSGDSEAFGFAGEAPAEQPVAEARRPARPGRADGVEGETAVPTARRAPRVIVPPRFDSATVAAAAGGGGGTAVARPAYGRGGGGGRAKKGIAGRITWMVLLWFVSMALAVGGIFYFLKVKQTSIGELHFQNVGALTLKQRNDLRQEQFQYVMSPQVRLNARSYAEAMGIPPGFLGDTEQFARIQPVWPDDRPATMTVQYPGTDANDRKRVFALLMGLYEENSKKANDALTLKRDIGKLEAKIKEYDGMRARRDELKRVVDAAPTPEAAAQLEAAVREADAAYDAATQAVKEAQLDVRRAEEQLPGSPGEALLKASTGGGDDANKPNATPADPELADLQRKLEAAASKAAELKSSASEEADAKRKMLDQAVEMFQQTAAEITRQNPQLAQYVQAVQQLQEKTHKLGGDLIEVQQQQHKRLSALKKDMDDQVQARRAEIWASDKGLSDLRAQLDLANRKFNAARDQGFTEDSREVRDALAEIRDLTARIDARKQTLGNDPIVTKVADALQELINITQERLDADRARIEKDIKDQEQAFAESGMIERLPAQQQAQAKQLDEKQRAISDLRKQYAAALDRRTAESNAALRDLESQVSSVRGKIDERKRFLAQDAAKNLTQQQEAERRANLERRQVALKKAEDQLATAQRVFVERTKALRNATIAQNEGNAARQEKEAIEQTLATKDEEAKLDKLALDERNDKLKKLVTVNKPVESDLRVESGRDDRMLFSLGAVIGLAFLFGIAAVASVAGGERRARLAETDFEEGMDDGDFEPGPMAIHEIGAHQE